MEVLLLLAKCLSTKPDFFAQQRCGDVLTLLISAVLLNEFFELLAAGFSSNEINQRLFFITSHNMLACFQKILLFVNCYVWILQLLIALLFFITPRALILFLIQMLV